jgi:aminopeptidase N
MKLNFIFLPLILILSLAFHVNAQNEYQRLNNYNDPDSLRGSLRKERMYDVTFYHLDIEVDIENKSIAGSNTMKFKCLENLELLQMDLFENMKISRISMDGNDLTFKRKFNAVFVDIPDKKMGDFASLKIDYNGVPIAAKRAPWDGGFVWEKDDNDKPWVGVACEGIGASLWWPNKDHLSDEPDSMAISITIPDSLFCVANGNLRSIENLNGAKAKFNWFVQYDINNYNVTLNIGDYAHLQDEYIAKDGSKLQLDYYVIKYNLEKAKTHFKQMHGILEAYEHFFGKYPYWKDGFALVETSYYGMEHQGAIAYGNKYRNRRFARSASADEKWDYILVHETAHEYFGNSVSCSDHAEMWIHESFATYMEALYLEFHYGLSQANSLFKSYRYHRNSQAIRGPRGINYDMFNSSDMYHKGAWVLHTLRNTLPNDKDWFVLLKAIYTNFERQVIESEDIFDFINKETSYNYDSFFEQYLSKPKIPFLIYDYDTESSLINIKLKTETPDFKLRIRYKQNLIELGSDKAIKLKIDDLDSFLNMVQSNYLVNIKEQ